MFFMFALMLVFMIILVFPMLTIAMLVFMIVLVGARGKTVFAFSVTSGEAGPVTFAKLEAKAAGNDIGFAIRVSNKTLRIF